MAHVDARGEPYHAGAVVVAVPWYALPELFSGDLAPVDELRRSAAGTNASPIASVNLWLDRRVLPSPFLGLPGRLMQWVFDRGQLLESGTSQLTLVSSGAATAMALQNEALIAVALRELYEAWPVARAARVQRASVVRERRATFSSGAGAAAEARDPDERRAALPGGYRIETGLPATIEGAAVKRPPRGRGAVMNSVVVHYQEIALKGRNRPWFIGRLVRNIRAAVSDLDVRQVVQKMGRIEVVLGTPDAWEAVASRLRSRLRGSPTSRVRRSCRSTSM